MMDVLISVEVPADGVILSGNTSLDESMITGESLPVNKGPGDKLIGGTINLSGMVHMKATKVRYHNTLFSYYQYISSLYYKK